MKLFLIFCAFWCPMLCFGDCGWGAGQTTALQVIHTASYSNCSQAELERGLAELNGAIESLLSPKPKDEFNAMLSSLQRSNPSRTQNAIHDLARRTLLNSYKIARLEVAEAIAKKNAE
jgi:hypothetical protein